MYEISEYKDRQYKIYKLTDRQSSSNIRISPERGGIVIGFEVEGKEILYLDSETFYDESQSVHGGIPILFPICGSLRNNEYVCNGKKYSMYRHGFARALPWRVKSYDTKDCASIQLELKSNGETRKMYPFDFEVLITYSLKGNKLTIQQEYVNKSDSDMPIHCGFHPYFNLSDKKNLEYGIQSDHYFDSSTNEIKPFNGLIDMSDQDRPKSFSEIREPQVSLIDRELKRRVDMNFSKEFKHVILWSSIGKSYICIEPWMAKINAFNTGEDINIVKPYDTYRAFLSIECQRE